MKLRSIFAVIACSLPLTALAEVGSGAKKFAQLGHLLDTPTEVRLASGAPGPDYWQQRADYKIDVTIDDTRQHLTGRETITYYNQSPHSLKYIWLQVDQNRFRPDSDDMLTKTAPNFEKYPYSSMAGLLYRMEFQGGVNNFKITDAEGNALPFTENKTMVRIDLPQPLKAGEQFVFNVAWDHAIVDATKFARGGYEFFEKNGNYIYEIAQWFPRVAAYTDYEGWNNKQFLGNGEFTLELGDYEVAITVPADHIVAATGVLQNAEDVLSRKQLKRYEEAQSADELMFIVTPEEAAQREQGSTSVESTWVFKAENVRDFAFASSRKFIWDAQSTPSGDKNVMAMSFYPNEAEPLWSQYSTASIVHTMEVYSRYTFEYPYPVSISVNGPVGGMEYPMITFNAPRPYDDGTYWDVSQKDHRESWSRSKYGLISVIIHEVGHNYFPMIVNSDERQWTWMDEGMNTFLQYIAEQEWEENYPSRRGPPENMTEYMTSGNVVPIMTNSESILQFGNNAYGKPATALNILRESIMGRELFDYAFAEFANRWKFKRPTPADFFRSMEDASAVDLDWFWRGWFYGTDYVDVAISDITQFTVDSRDPEVEKAWQKAKDDELEPTLSDQRNENLERLVDKYPALNDFYNDYDDYTVTPWDYAQYEKTLKALSDKEKALLAMDKHFYTVTFDNLGGLVTPLPLRISYADGATEEMQIPAEIWRRNAEQVTKLFVSEREITAIEIDPYRSTADADVYNNSWPRKVKTSRFRLHMDSSKPNHMRRDEKTNWEKKDK
ncbi:aminopeptidase [Halioglobus sp. HI00S01]|uniref:M1 family metallopeptidase n=2 Tax=Halioglobus sp. HI00S01 TaxID=1822214 RepID=UPI0007C22DB2|nr:M1 family metallopeptidase [Halioglobus sp. HI00S01]KZX59318.1 aminopeptidase [Halioglobus sp. HI00S01]